MAAAVMRQDEFIENGRPAWSGDGLGRGLSEIGTRPAQEGEQLDLFSGAGLAVAQPSRQGITPVLVPADLDPAALIAAIPESSLGDSAALAAEAGRRRLAAAVPALAALCRRFAGFGVARPVAEQAAALQALASIGGHEAAQAVAQMIERVVVQGPTLQVAVSAAARLRARLSAAVLCALLRHADAGIRADACRCARPAPEVVAVLVDLLDDLDRRVARSAACALGRMGRIEARELLKRLLHEAPSAEVIDALAPIADEECAVVLGRIARSTPSLAAAALEALDGIDHPRAGAIAAAARRSGAG